MDQRNVHTPMRPHVSRLVSRLAGGPRLGRSSCVSDRWLSAVARVACASRLACCSCLAALAWALLRLVAPRAARLACRLARCSSCLAALAWALLVCVGFGAGCSLLLGLCWALGLAGLLALAWRPCSASPLLLSPFLGPFLDFPMRPCVPATPCERSRPLRTRGVRRNAQCQQMLDIAIDQRWLAMAFSRMGSGLNKS